jgi:hypothetical protein
MVGEVLGLERLHDRSVEAHGLESLDLDDGPHAARALPPPLARSVQVPGAGHAHVGVEDGPVVPADLDVLAAAVDALDDGTDGGASALQAGGLEPGHDLLQQRGPERRGGPMDGVTLGHGSEVTRS